MLKRLSVMLIVSLVLAACAVKYDPYQHPSQQQQRSDKAMQELDRAVGN